MQLNPVPPATYPQGEINFEGRNLLDLKEKELYKIRGNEISMIFQDPMSSLNPVFRIGNQLLEAIRTYQPISKKNAEKKAIELLTEVGITDPIRRMYDNPHKFSVGMMQSVLI